MRAKRGGLPSPLLTVPARLWAPKQFGAGAIELVHCHRNPAALWW